MVRRAGTGIEFIPIDISDIIRRTEAAPNPLDTASKPPTCRWPAEPTPWPPPRPMTARDAFASRSQRPGPKTAVPSAPKVSAGCEKQHARAPTRIVVSRDLEVRSRLGFETAAGVEHADQPQSFAAFGRRSACGRRRRCPGVRGLRATVRLEIRAEQGVLAAGLMLVAASKQVSTERTVDGASGLSDCPAPSRGCGTKQSTEALGALATRTGSQTASIRRVQGPVGRSCTAVLARR